MPWTTRGTKEDKETTEEIERQEDRAAAIIAAAYFENRLMLAIQERLEDDAKVINSFFQNMGPLASFSAKIDLAYLMRILQRTYARNCTRFEGSATNSHTTWLR